MRESFYYTPERWGCCGPICYWIFPQVDSFCRCSIAGSMYEVSKGTVEKSKCYDGNIAGWIWWIFRNFDAHEYIGNDFKVHQHVLCSIKCICRTWGALHLPQIAFVCTEKHMGDVYYNIGKNMRLKPRKLRSFKSDMLQLSNASRIAQNGRVLTELWA